MCGIFGILAVQNLLDTKKFDIPNQSQEIQHRGPDDYGYFLSPKVYLAQRRLSIIDLSTGKQPIFNEEGSICIVFNGEIFNFKEIREVLKKKGHTFTTNTDTEVIIHSYEEWGPECVNKFRGMFAFAIWDEKHQNLFIARDRLGIKPLFYAMYEDTLYFASEMKSILRYKHIPREIDYDALACYFTLSYISVPLTIYKHIKKLPPGHILEVKDGKMNIHEYWDIHFYPNYTKPESYFLDGIMGILEEAVELRMISDVPIGAFLSGGVDSGTIVALMSKLSTEPVRSFCMGFGGNVGGHLDERGYAQQVASRYGTIHHNEIVTPNLHGIVDEIVNSFDEPFADHSTIPSYYLCQTTRKSVTVALSGLGGDELFGGYERYLGFKASTYYNKLPLVVREKLIRPIVEKIPERTDGHYTINHLKRFVRAASQPEDLRYFGFLSLLGKTGSENLFREPEKFSKYFSACQESFTNTFNSAKAEDPLDKVFYCDIKTYLPEDILACTDRMSMRHSLEVRVPFLDHKLMEFCATIPSEMKIKFWQKKYILKKAVAKILPNEILTHRKQGFEGPMTQWLQNDLKSYVLDILSEKELNKHDLFNKSVVKTILDDHFNRVEINDTLIWSLVVFQTWYNNYIS